MTDPEDAERRTATSVREPVDEMAVTVDPSVVARYTVAVERSKHGRTPVPNPIDRPLPRSGGAC